MKNHLADFKFCHLKSVKIECFEGMEYEMWWIKIFLEKAVVLESLILIYHPKYREILEYADEQLLLSDRLLSMERASSRAKVIVSTCEEYSGLYHLDAAWETLRLKDEWQYM